MFERLSLSLAVG